MVWSFVAQLSSHVVVKWKLCLFITWCAQLSLQWRHNECNSVSNHQPHDCLLNCLFRRRSKKTLKLRVTVQRINCWPVKSTHKGPATRKISPSHDVIMMLLNMFIGNKWLISFYCWPIFYNIKPLTSMSTDSNIYCCGVWKILIVWMTFIPDEPCLVWHLIAIVKIMIMMMSSNGNIFCVTGPLCGVFTGLGEFPTQRPVTRSFDVFFDLRLNKRLSKQPCGWWFEPPSWSLWRHRNGYWHKLKCMNYKLH